MVEDKIYYDPFNEDTHADEEAKTAAIKADKTYLSDLSNLAKTPAGRRVLRRIIGYTRPLNTTFTGNSQGMFLEGGRNVGLRIIADLNAADDNLGINMLLAEG